MQFAVKIIVDAKRNVTMTEKSVWQLFQRKRNVMTFRYEQLESLDIAWKNWSRYLLKWKYGNDLPLMDPLNIYDQRNNDK